jgi:secernin
MCDTYTAIANSTKNGSVILAKNSDREINEPHIIVRVPRKKHMPNEKTKCTYIEIEEVPETFEAYLFKPSWIWGAEMGVNEYGVTIGNEAVFTKMNQGSDALLGMDILRLCLERCKTAAEAVEYIGWLLEKYGQGGKCGYTGNLRYDNSFLIADFTSAYVVDTAGKQWVSEKVSNVRSISNSISIGKKYDSCSKDVIETAVNNLWCDGKDDFNFKECYDDKKMSTIVGGDLRRHVSQSVLNHLRGNVTVDEMKKLLRYHDETTHGNEFTRLSDNDLCAHGGDAANSQTTGSFVVELIDQKINIWATGTSLPCVSVFKPLWFTQDRSLFGEADAKNAVRSWREKEVLRRMILENRITNLDKYRDSIAQLEAELAGKAKIAETDKEKTELTKYAFQREDEIVKKFISENEHHEAHIGGTKEYAEFWKKQNSELESSL